jgi:predicted Zn-dependent protease
MNALTRPMVLLAAMLVAGCDAPSAIRPDFAYDPTSLSNGTLYRWPSGSTLSVYVEPPESGVSALTIATSRAMTAWNEVPEFAEFQLQGTASLNEADIVLYDRSTPNPLTPGSCLFDPRGSGYTYFCLDGGRAQVLLSASAQPTKARVLISVDRGAVNSQERYDAVVAHEMGHALGIGGHSQELSDLMYGAPIVVRPSGRDRQTLHYVLGQEPDAVLR